jgi:oligopeptide/dipeptide ABC transporter ATP-binding protein
MFSHAHPYTRGLIGSIPKLDKKQDRLDTIEGIVPNMFKLPKGCNFAPRCKRAKEICHDIEPVMAEFNGPHRVACHFPIEGGE